LVNRPIKIFREITKYYEELVATPIVAGTIKPQGEFTLVIGPSGTQEQMAALDDDVAVAVVDYLTDKMSLGKNLAFRRASDALRVPESVIKKAWKRSRGYRR
jgi:hypothetical protein